MNLEQYTFGLLCFMYLDIINQKSPYEFSLDWTSNSMQSSTTAKKIYVTDIKIPAQ